MPQDYQVRARKSALRIAGKSALLRGADAGYVHIGKNVVLDRGLMGIADDSTMIRYTVATIMCEHAPAVGDLLEHPDGNFMLDRLADDDGISARYIVVPA